MPGLNLTRDEARERASTVTTGSYDVTVDLSDPGPATFPSDTTIRFSARPGAETFVDLVAPTVRVVELNGRPLDPAVVFDGTRITLTDLAADNVLRVVADCAYMRTGEGLHRFVDPVDGAVYLYTQFEVMDARRVFACFDQPDLKATFTFTVTAPDGWQVVSNSVTPTPDPAADGTSVWRFATTPRLSTYVTALIAGPYHVERDEHRGIPMAVLCRRTLAPFLDADEIFAVTRQGLDYFEEKFDRAFPFDKYDQAFVPEFNAGAMENAGAVTILEDYVFRSKVTDAAYERRAETALHELAHMWFGDLVTMRWWDDLWLNESFATYASVQCQSQVTRWGNAWTTFANLEKTWAYRQDQLPTTHPIVADIHDLEDVEVNFDGITYAKGASVLKQLVAWVGEDAFFTGMQRYFARHEWGNTSLGDLLAILEEVSGRDLSHWAKQWLESAGVNTLLPEYAVADDGRISSFVVRQSAPAEHPTLRSHRLRVGLYDAVDGRLARRRQVELDVVGDRTEVPELVGEPRPDLVLVNDDDLTYAKIRLDPASLATLVAGIGRFREGLPRALAWAAAWDMTRDAEISTRDFVALVLQGVPAEQDIGVLQGILRQAASALQAYAAPEHREPGLVDLADGLLALARAAEPSSDRQLAFVRAFTGLARTPEQLDVVAGLYRGDVALDGLAVDTDLRWGLLQRLVVTGRAGDDEIDAEQRRDDTAMGKRQATATRAMRPTPEAKLAAWTAAVEQDELPNALLTATVAGFANPDQRELLRPFVDRYFDAVAGVWSARTNETAQTIVIGLYPSYLVEQETVDRTDAYLAQAQPVPALRRLLVEGRDGVARALRAQRRDAAG